MIRTVVHGAGRMARSVLAQLSGYDKLEPVALVSRTLPDDCPGIDWFASLEELQSDADLLIDFTLPGGARAAARWCAANNVALVSGTTGLVDKDIEALKSASREVPVLWAPNLSHGVALVTALVRQAAAALGVGAEISINDVHHRHKLDAPSGTALALAGAALEGRLLGSQSRLDGEGSSPGTEDGDVAFSSVREGEVIGEHTISFTMPNELIEITHKALDRTVFAKGALKAGEWLVGQKPGYYSTSDWLGLD
ncbi:MAG: 4-hydroxy-tetrahydrodipicolinate reductase [Xanthomonadales bacterium]|nr:4-hydroxy-tetrahydrodipicolinate reductase [Xanthomonadales bacterium]